MGQSIHAGCGGNVTPHDFGEKVPTLLCDRCHCSIRFPWAELMPRGGFKPEPAPVLAWANDVRVES